MAGAKSGVHVLQLKPISVPKSLQEGSKFVKWDDDSALGTPVTLRVDKNGFFLYWTDQNKETEFLEISSIRDTRTGKYAKTPKEGKLRDSVTMGAADTPLEDKTLSVVYGPDLVNVSMIHFCCNCRELAQLWTEELLRMAYNLLSINAPSSKFLEKAHTKLLLMTDREGRLPVKNVLKMFAQHRDDRKRVERALEAVGLATGKNETVAPDRFTFDVFLRFYRQLVGRQEVDSIFEKLCGGNKKKVMTVDQLVDFLNKEQRDPRLNEILYPYANPARARDIIAQYEPNKSYVAKGHFSVEGFLRYLMGADNPIVSPEKFDLSFDMDQPLNHYFINSSHNTYLTGHQLTGKSSVEMYRQCLLAGCRCIELDCWTGRNSDEEPIITHGYTVVTEILLKEVIEAIAESAFKTSEFPVILSFENHCSPKQQAKMAMYCRKFFADMLVTEPLSSHPLKSGQPLPSAKQLMRKIIIKNKKKHHTRPHKAPPPQGVVREETESGESDALMSSPLDSSGIGSSEMNGDPKAAVAAADMEDWDTDSGTEEEEVPDRSSEDQNEGTAAKETEAVAEMSALVNYIQPVRFHSFEHAEKRDRSYEISSFVETQATNLLKEHPVEFVNYNKRQLSRIYPSGTRVSSSNYMPQVFWNAGCQLIALNYQTLDLGMQLNLGIFEFNARSGYLLKPDFMRRADRKFDPFTESTVDGIIAGTVSIRIISGQFLTDKHVGTYVEVDMFGLPADTVRRRFRTRTVPANGINPVYDEEPFVFKKVVLPDLAVLRISVCEDSGKLLGHRILPVVGLRPGYRHVSLRNESGQPLLLQTLFVQVTVKDYVPDGLSELADALANPIKYQSRIEKHATQLRALTDDLDEGPTAAETKLPAQVSSPAAAGAGGALAAGHAGGAAGPSSPGGAAGSEAKGNSPRGAAEVTDGGPASTTLNGGVQRSPDPKLVRQDTLTRKLDQTVRSLSDEGSQEKTLSLLESSEANLTAEPLEKLREHKSVQKVLGKLEKDLSSARRRYDKLRDKERDSQLQRAEKVAQAAEKHKAQLCKSHSKLGKKFSCGDVMALKQQNESQIQNLDAETRAKQEELQKSHNLAMLNITKEQYRAEMDIQHKYIDSLFGALEKSMQASQAAQMQQLQDLHDREVSELMKRLETQTKEEMRSLNKKHKDKNELDRIKRELHQKMIGEAVAERQRISSLLEKKKSELERQHEEVRKSLEEDKQQASLKHQKEYEEKCGQLAASLNENPALFLEPSVDQRRQSTAL
ncbi:1-phosphatidylinositol 4,5-bisphosphate phosphodiesterase classes I and II-like isoform X1 [Ornithodoros turicata]|uniref:1-phosphatidylinositol 4,5-bisphosphate phosphodiesterase classes I and II-like isoform X1 n=2 Tax=Ornithodoros turicata TaxID=34597 RepID=UPI003139AEB6